MTLGYRIAAYLVGEGRRVAKRAPARVSMARRDRLAREVARLRTENQTLLNDANSYLAAGYRALAERDALTRAAAYRADKAVAAWMNHDNKERDNEPFGTAPKAPFRPLPPLKPTATGPPAPVNPFFTPPPGDAA